MKVLLVSEGKHESSGALETLVSRLASVEIQCKQERVNRRDLHAHHGKGKGYFKRAMHWMSVAKKKEYDALILVIDEDGRSERVREITDAQESEHSPVRHALGVAIRTFDAWMLADEGALSDVLACNVPRQRDPETIADPKDVCERLLAESEGTIRQRDMYAKVVRVADIGTLEGRCPRGFAPFAGRVRRL